MRKQTVMCNDVKVTIGYDEETDRAESMVIDIGILSPKAIKESVEILLGVLELGRKGKEDESGE